jgi:hypothetical protein
MLTGLRYLARASKAAASGGAFHTLFSCSTNHVRGVNPRVGIESSMSLHRLPLQNS